MYAEDSLFTLNGPEIAGVLAISLALWLACLALVGLGRGRSVRLALAVLVLAGFVWLSPQAYYLYYMAIFDGLPWQRVTGQPPTPAHLLRLLTFTQEASLSRHGQGALGWSLIGTALLSPSRGARS